MDSEEYLNLQESFGNYKPNIYSNVFNRSQFSKCVNI